MDVEKDPSLEEEAGCSLESYLWHPVHSFESMWVLSICKKERGVL